MADGIGLHLSFHNSANAATWERHHKVPQIDLHRVSDTGPADANPRASNVDVRAILGLGHKLLSPATPISNSTMLSRTSISSLARCIRNKTPRRATPIAHLSALNLSRRLSTSSPRHNSTSILTREHELGAAEETHEVTTLDRLLKIFRAPSPSYLLPVRSRSLWSEALLRNNLPPSTTDPTTSSDARPTADTPRNMHESYCELVLPFASSPELLEQYINASGGIRTGMLMEHLDSLAGSIAYRHVLGPTFDSLSKKQGIYIVTASVDRLDMLAPLYPVRDMRLSGQVIHTGRSSMEIAVRMEALEKDGSEETIMVGRFFMVCRDARTHKAAPVNPLSIETPEDQMLFNIGEVAPFASDAGWSAVEAPLQREVYGDNVGDEKVVVALGSTCVPGAPFWRSTGARGYLVSTGIAPPARSLDPYASGAARGSLRFVPCWELYASKVESQ
ncbi:predicted protein [Postia placenta Mad-698-R]|nr:predicted protein [Postia placenta Mad-698-R]